MTYKLNNKNETLTQCCLNVGPPASGGRPHEYERVYLSLCNVVDTPFDIQGKKWQINPFIPKLADVIIKNSMSETVRMIPNHTKIVIIYRIIIYRKKIIISNINQIRCIQNMDKNSTLTFNYNKMSIF